MNRWTLPRTIGCTRWARHSMLICALASCGCSLSHPGKSVETCCSCWKDPLLEIPLQPVGFDATDGVKTSSGYIDCSGRTRIAQMFLDVKRFSEDRAAARVAAGWGFIDRHSRYVVTPRFHDVKTFSEGRAGVKIWGWWGFIDPNGEMVVAPRFESIQSFVSGVACVRSRGLWGLVDRNGQWVHARRYLEMTRGVSECIYVTALDGRRGLLSPKGETILEPRYLAVIGALNRPVFACDTQGWGMYDRKGVKLEAVQFTAVKWEGWSEDMACVRSPNGLWGYISAEGKWVIAPKFKEAGTFSGGLAAVQTKTKACFIDAKGREMIQVTPPRYPNGYEWQAHGVPGHLPCFQGRWCVIKVGTRRGVIDRSGKWVIDPMYELCWLIQDKWVVVGDGRTLALINLTSGQRVIAGNYWNIRATECQEVFAVTSEEGGLYVTASGTIIWRDASCIHKAEQASSGKGGGLSRGGGGH